MDNNKMDNKNKPDHRRPTRAQVMHRMHELALAAANRLDVDEPPMVDPGAKPTKETDRNR